MAPAPTPMPGHRPGPTNVVILSKIPEGVSEQQLAMGVGRASEVLHLSFRPSDLDGPGWAIVAFASPEFAKAAKDRLDGKALPGLLGSNASIMLEAVLGEGLFGNLRSLSDQESPWKEARTPQGHVYYFHTVTRQTTWVKPPPDFGVPTMGAPQKVAPPAARMPSQPLPPMVQGQAAFQAAQAAVNAAAAPAPLIHTNLNSGPIGANLFIYHIPTSWDDYILKQHFEHFGKIISCRVQVDNDGRSRGFGFVSFDLPGSAQAAIAGMHGFPVEGRHLKVQLKKGDEQHMSGGGGAAAPTALGPVLGGLLDIQQPALTFNIPPPPPGLPSMGQGPGGFGLMPPQMAPRPGPY